MYGVCRLPNGADPMAQRTDERDNQRVTGPVRALVVDDEAFARSMVSGTLSGHGVAVVGVAEGIAQALDVPPASYDVAILDLDLGPGPNGIDLGLALRRRSPRVGIVLLTSFSDPRLIAASVKEPPPDAAYVVKQSLTDIGFLLAAVHAVARGAVDEVDVPRVPLTDAQIETLRLLAYGLSNAEIARVRVVTEKSVEQAIKRAATGLGVDPSPSINQRVALARAFFALTGAARHTHAHR